MGRKQDKHAVGGILCSGVTPSILTQARRRRATPFVRLVQQPSEENRKVIWVSGQTADFPLLYHHQSRRDMSPAPQWRLSPVPRPTVSLTVLLCGVQQGMHGVSWGSMLLGDSKGTWWEGVPRTGAPQRPNMDDSGSCPHAAETTARFPINQRAALHRTKRHRPPLPPLYAHLLLRPSQEAFFYMQIYTGCLGSQKTFLLKKKKLSL